MPSTNSMPRSRMMTSLAAPSQMPSTGFGPDQVLAGLDDLAGEQRRHAGVQGVAQVGQPDACPTGRPAAALRPRSRTGRRSRQRLHLLAGEGVDHRQVVGRVRESRPGRSAPLAAIASVEHLPRPGRPIAMAPSMALGADHLRHSSSLRSFMSKSLRSAFRLMPSASRFVSMMLHDLLGGLVRVGLARGTTRRRAPASPR